MLNLIENESGLWAKQVPPKAGIVIPECYEPIIVNFHVSPSLQCQLTKGQLGTGRFS